MVFKEGEKKRKEERERLRRERLAGGSSKKYICSTCGVISADSVYMVEALFGTKKEPICNRCGHLSTVYPYTLQKATDWKIEHGYEYFTPKGEPFECPNCGCKTYKKNNFLGYLCTDCARTFTDPDVYTKK